MNARKRPTLRRRSVPRLFETLENRSLLAADLIISEFMASNNGTVADEDGNFSDWIEIHNRGTENVDLQGWYLTDDANELNKWAIPSETLSPGGFLLVWASGKDRGVAGSPLHTNFSLDADGEYLALSTDNSDPNATEDILVVSDYAPNYPQQIGDVSYGVGQNVNISRLMRASDTTNLHFPTTDVLGTSWVAQNFDDSSWTAGTAAIGYESSVPGFTVQDAKSSGRISNIAASLALLSGTGRSSETTVVSPTINFRDPGGGGGSGNFGDPDLFPNDSGGNDDDFAVRATGTIIIPSSGTWTFGTNSDDGVRVRVDGSNVINDDTLHAPADRFGRVSLTAGPHEIEMVFFERGGGAEVELFAAKGAFTTFNRSAFELIGDTASGGLEVQTVPGQAGAAGNFSPFISTDVGDAMADQASSAYVRAQFLVNDVSKLSSLSLRVQYDDAFIAYINGVEVARRNAPAGADATSTALTDRASQSAVIVENIDVTSQLGLINNGLNVLAVHALNDAVDSGEFLFTAELAEVTVTENARVYFETPTPGEFNSDDGVDGFLLDEIQMSQPHGFYDQAITVSLSSLTAGTTIRYTLDGTEPTTSNGSIYSQPLAINKTTTLRARAFKSGLSPSYVETATYLFIDDIVRQSANGAAPPGFPSSTNINGQTLNYGMDPQIVNDATWGPQLVAALTQVPSMSIVMDIDDLLSASKGIYTNAQSRGRSWERPASLELIQPDGTTGFQVDAGIRIRGGFSRSGNNPKHAFRFFFRNEYGPGKLDFPLFDGEGVDEFDGFDLRTTQNYSWSFQGSGRNTFLRDVFSRDLQGQMGQPYTRSRYYHLYINGQYWGLYQTQERSEASYAASYFGGEPDDYDVIKSTGSAGGYQNEATDGNMSAYQRLADFFYQNGGLGDSKTADYWKAQGMNPDGSRNPNFERLLDVDNLIDYMIITYYTGDRDGPASRFVTGRVNNYFSIFDRGNPDGFKFFEHDSEHSLGTGDSNMVSPRSQGGNNFRYFNPHWMHEQLASSNSEYRQRFADRVYEVLFNDGVLTPQNAQALIDTRAAQFDTAILAESARWGDSKRGTPFTKTDWQNAVNGIRGFISNRRTTLLQQLNSQGWYPDATPAQITVNGSLSSGGAIASDDLIGMFAQSSTTFESIVAASSTWKYLDNGSNQGTAWRQLAFNDNAWSSGKAELGYGDGGEATTVACGPTAPNCGTNKYITTYFRKSFDVTNPGQYQTLRVRLQRDDGAAVYLNGQEVVRDNLAANAAYDQYAAGVVGGGDERTFFDFEIDASLLVSGENVLAVEIHQQNANSSDISFDLVLEGGTLNLGNSTVYYTLDGTDPRSTGGQVSASATLYDGNPFSLPGTATLSARNVDAGEWSPIRKATFLLDAPATAANLRISEINYNPHEPLTQFDEADVNNDDFEFVELTNIGDVTIDLTGVRFVQSPVDGSNEGIEFDFGTQTIAPGQQLVVARDRTAFVSRYGNDVPLAESATGAPGTGTYGGSLRNSGEQITLIDSQDQIIQQFTYRDSGAWPGRADGGASSLEVKDLLGDYTAASNFRNSNAFGGSPGRLGAAGVSTVVINELLTHTDLPQIDAIELLNTTDQPIDVSRWYVSDGADEYLRYQISPNAESIGAGSYLVIDENQLGFGFRGQASDDAWLIEADATGRPVRFADHVEFGAAQNGTSLGRWPDGSGDLFPMTQLTFAAANSGPIVGDVVLAEVHYAPTPAAAGDVLSTNEREFVEIRNRTNQPLDIGHWRLNKGVDFDFEAGTTLAAQGRLAVVGFDPIAESDKTVAFRQLYGIDNGVTLIGPWDGVLDNGGETLQLERPEDLAQLGLGYVLVDRVDYDNAAPWPVVEEQGPSIHRDDDASYGDFATSWTAGTATPGTVTQPDRPGDFNGDDVVDLADIDLLCGDIARGGGDTTFDLNGDSAVDRLDMDVMIEGILGTSFGDSNLDGQFDSGDLILVFQAGQYEDTATDNSSWATGDWNCDGEFDSGDMIYVFQKGGYVSSAVPTATSGATPPSARPRLALAAAAVDSFFDDDTRIKESRNS